MRGCNLSRSSYIAEFSVFRSAINMEEKKMRNSLEMVFALSLVALLLFVGLDLTSSSPVLPAVNSYL